MRKLFPVRRERVNDEPLVAKEPVDPPAPEPGEKVERQPPDNTVYLDQNIEEGRSRIIIMLSEDGKIIEPVMRIKMSEAQYVSILSQQADIATQEMVSKAVHMQGTMESLAAEVEFLREQVRKGASPPAEKVVPRPFEDVGRSSGVGE
jgi:hypothetical protein